MYTTEGLILKRVDTGEYDSLFTIYTKDFGKIRALARGVKKESAKLKGHLEPLNLSSINFVLGRNGERLTHANLLNPWPAVRSDWEKLRAAYAIIDMVDENTMPGERDEALWRLLLRGFEELERRDMRESFLGWFRREFVSIVQPQDFGLQTKFPSVET